MLTDFKEVVTAVAEVERGVERVGGMVGDEDEDVALRGVICVRNLIEVSGGEFRKRLRDAGISEKIGGLAKRTRLKGICGEVLEQMQ
jgi:hypothetical protein